jgi:EAL domain-containing protein (putative c-di-GMP-specific phosphodiesterase class I)
MIREQSRVFARLHIALGQAPWQAGLVQGSSHPPRTRLRDASAQGELNIELALSQVTAYLQPVVSVRERSVRLVESLARGHDVAGRTRPPAELFAEATRGGYMARLGERCRREAFAAYRVVQAQERAPMLSINTDSSLVLEGAVGAEKLVNEVLENGIAPSRVALEILESILPDVDKLEEFCRAVKRAGFLLALDDIGTGYSNLERIPRLEPDILKIDRQLVHGMSESYHRREVFRSLLQLAHQIGALAIAEGVENEGDVRTALSLGCDLFQGYYFGHPIDVRDGKPLCDLGRLREAGDQFRADAKRRLNERRARQRRSEQAMRTLVTTLKSTTEDQLAEVLREALQSMPFVEALYVLDDRGV